MCVCVSVCVEHFKPCDCLYQDQYSLIAISFIHIINIYLKQGLNQFFRLHLQWTLTSDQSTLHTAQRHGYRGNETENLQNISIFWSTFSSVESHQECIGAGHKANFLLYLSNRCSTVRHCVSMWDVSAAITCWCWCETGSVCFSVISVILYLIRSLVISSFQALSDGWTNSAAAGSENSAVMCNSHSNSDV